MSFNTNWDVDQYKTEHESAEHWELRRNFMVVHKDKFPEERLVCLAQVFSNVEFLGCRYPAETMELVAELSEGVAEAYREKQKTKLQRTFVKASDAAGAKVKGLKRPAVDAGAPSDVPPKITKCSDDSPLITANRGSEETEQKNINKPNIDCIDESRVSNSDSPDVIEIVDTKLNLEEETSETIENSCIEDTTNFKCFNQEVTPVPKLNQKLKRKLAKEAAKMGDSTKWETVSAGIFGRLVLIEDENDNHGSVLLRSTSTCGIPYQCVCEEGVGGEVCYKIFVNKNLVVSVSDTCKQTARYTATTLAVKKLQDICYTLKIKKERIPAEIVVELSHILNVGTNGGVVGVVPNPKALATPIPEDNLGRKLMRSMGWTGGGLGKTEQGIQEPVSVSLKNCRTGFGAQRPPPESFKIKARQFLLQYLCIDFPPNLVFKSDNFSFTERDIIHTVAKAMGYQTKLTAKGDTFRLVISTKISLAQVAVGMIIRGVTSDEYYEIIEPKCPDAKVVTPQVPEISAFHPILENEVKSSINKNILESSSTNENLLDSDCKNLSKAAMRRLKRERKSARRQEKRQEKAKALENLKNCSIDAVMVGPYGNFFLVEYENSEDSPMQILRESSNCNHICVKYMSARMRTGSICKVFVNSHLLTTAYGTNNKNARIQSYRTAYEKLKEICYTLKVKQGAKNGPVIDRDLELKFPFNSDTDVKPSVSGSDTNNLGNSVDKPLCENIGSRLMRSMGWSGGGLGKNQQGIEEPIGMSTQFKRTGLGHTTEEKFPKKQKESKKVEPQFRAKFKVLMENYKRIDSTFDLYFSSLFSKAERAMMHVEAFKLGLKSKSFGKDDDRYLVVSKKKDLCKIVESMLQSDKKFSSQYELIKPSIALSPAEELEVPVNDYPGKSENVKSTPSDHLNTKASDISRIKKDPETEMHPISIIKREPHQEIPDLSLVKKESSLISTVQRSNQETLGQFNTSISCGENLEQDKIIPSIVISHRHYVHGEQFGLLVLIEDENCTTPAQIIEKSANGCHIPFRIEYLHDKPKMTCELVLNGVVVASASACSKKVAKEMTVYNGLEKLREVCYTLRTQVVKVGENNIKFIKTLRLPYKKRRSGKGKQNGSNIVCTSQLIDHSCLGIEKEEELTKNKIRNYLQDYISQIWPYDLIITPDFSADETFLFQRIASSLSLKASFQKISRTDFLIISKKLSPVDTAVAMLLGDGQISASV